MIEEKAFQIKDELIFIRRHLHRTPENDFEEIKLDSAENLKGKFIYQITGHVAADCVEKWADATEHSIGKRIGFVLQDEVICTPCINCRIETGSFAISAQDTDIKSIYWQIVRKIHSR